jgi:hypothetical protein
MIEYQFWTHRTSGEVWAVRLVDGKVDGSCGPLRYDERNVPLNEYEYDHEDDDWFAEYADQFVLATKGV